MIVSENFYKGKKVLVTGHTGFKGSWLTLLLSKMGAKVYGYSLAPSTTPSLFGIIEGEKFCTQKIADIADLESLKESFESFQPEIVFHLAAQPIVLEGYKRPVYTYRTNVLGTVNLMECVRLTPSVKSVLNVTTDKVYKNVEKPIGYKEEDELCGFDPYSNSKSCSELVTYSYINSFLKGKVAVSCARAGNVIGGGDFSDDRIIPDCSRALSKGEAVTIRNPLSVRPYQHVLEPLFTYLTIAARQYENAEFAGNYNIGPDVDDCLKTEQLVKIFCGEWGEGASYKIKPVEGAPHESGLLMLNNEKVKKTFGIRPVWKIEEAVKKTAEWYKSFYSKENMLEKTFLQIEEFIADRAKVCKS